MPAVTSAGNSTEPGSAVLLMAAQLLADFGHDGGKEPCGGLNPALLGVFHEPQSVVVSVFHFTQQVEVTDGSSHGA